MMIIGIVIFYEIRDLSYKDRNEKTFIAVLIVTFISILISFIGCLLIETYKNVPYIVNEAFQTIYFITTPLMALSFTVYEIVFILDNKPKKYISKWLAIAGIPYYFWVVMCLLNPFFHYFFYFDENGYQQGYLNKTMYLIFLIYFLMLIIIPIVKRKEIKKEIIIIMLLYTLSGFAIIAIQLIYISCGQNVVLSGISAAIPILIIYLFIQRQTSLKDSDTGLYTKRVFIKRIDSLLKSSTNSIIGMINFSNFNEISIKLGKKYVDELKIEIAKELIKITGRDRIFIYRDDRLAFTFVNNEYEIELIQKIIKRLRLEFCSQNIETKVTFSVGIITIPSDADSLEDIISTIEMIIRQCEINHKDVAYGDDRLKEKMKRKRDLVEKINQAILNDEIHVFYQPIVSIVENKYDRCEALARIYDNGSPISPAEFIPVAEELGLTEKIDYIVLDKALKTYKKLLLENIRLEGISINFVSSHFADPNFYETVKKIMDENELPPSVIRIEITESVLLVKNKLMFENIKKFQDAGYKFYLDDFGTGFSNIALAMSISFDTIKIDRSIIVEAMNNDTTLGLFESITKTLIDNGLKVLAEGVETIEQKELVKKCGCTFVQGFLYSKPTPSAHFIELMKKKHKKTL